MYAKRRRRSRVVKIGPLAIGGGRPIALQSMLSVPLSSAAGCLEQINQLVRCGCFLIRVAIPTARALADFERLRSAVSERSVAFVADLHFNCELAMDALDVFEKVRINPGNFSATSRSAAEKYNRELFNREKDIVEVRGKDFFQKARRLGKSVRIGSNGGSISARMEWNCGRGAEALIAGAMEMAQWAREVDFHDLVFSFKHSGVMATIDANRLARKRMDEVGWDYPFHLGVTEAGKGFRGRAAAAIGSGVLMCEGLGDTLRVSLTEPPAEEINFAKKLVNFCEKMPFLSPPERSVPVRICEVDEGAATLSLPAEEEPFDGDDYLLKTLHRLLSIENLDAVSVPPGPNCEPRKKITEALLQTCGWGRFSTDVISCPTCGRTGYDVGSVVDEISEKLGIYPHLRIAVMGCVVNGIGEMGDADYGYIGCGNGLVNLYRKGICAVRSIPEADAVGELAKLLKADGEIVPVQPSGT